MGNQISATAEHWLQGSKVKNDLVYRKSKDQGNHECQVLGEGQEAEESDVAWKHCTKNPGHGTFIPAPDFSLEHLPELFRDETLLKLVRTTSALTVRLTVGYTSRQRPDGYTFSKFRGKTIPHMASGLVYHVSTGDGPCQCSSCRQSSSPLQEWYKLHIMTACHAVYDSEEARSTKADVFYDDETSVQEGRMKSAKGVEVLASSVEDDTCEMSCVTHDRDLAETLLFHVEQEGRLRQEINSNKLGKNWWYRICLVVSHPHGQTKKITVGEMKWRVKGEERVKFLYSADTCPGSSGAAILYLGNYRYFVHLPMFLLPPHSSGGLKDGLNMSGSGAL